MEKFRNINKLLKQKKIFLMFIFFFDQSEIICSLKNPTELYASKITFIKKNTKKIKLFRKENVFYQKVKNILNKNDISATYINDVIKDLDLVNFGF